MFTRRQAGTSDEYWLLSLSGNGCPHDIQALATLVAGYAGGLIAADKGFIDQYQQAMLAEHQGMQVVTPPRARMTLTQPCCLGRACARWRKVVETVGSQLTEHFAVARIRVRDLWHFQARLIRKVLTFPYRDFSEYTCGPADDTA